MEEERRENALQSTGGATVSDSEATLQRRRSSGSGDEFRPGRLAAAASAFWSDGEPDPNSTPKAASEDDEDDDEVFRLAAASTLLDNRHPAERGTFFDGTNGSSGIDRDHKRWDQSHHQGRSWSPKILAFSSAPSSSKTQRNHKKDDEIREIFTLIDKARRP